jgi:hypothetical protein
MLGAISKISERGCIIYGKGIYFSKKTLFFVIFRDFSIFLGFFPKNDQKW